LHRKKALDVVIGNTYRSVLRADLVGVAPRVLDLGQPLEVTTREIAVSADDVSDRVQDGFVRDC
jgi:hypothetical protein